MSNNKTYIHPELIAITDRVRAAQYEARRAQPDPPRFAACRQCGEPLRFDTADRGRAYCSGACRESAARGEPTPDEIRELAAVLRDHWAKPQSHSVYPESPWAVPRVSVRPPVITGGDLSGAHDMQYAGGAFNGER